MLQCPNIFQEKFHLTQKYTWRDPIFALKNTLQDTFFIIPASHPFFGFPARGKSFFLKENQRFRTRQTSVRLADLNRV
jgi:hypothetical protein